MTIERAKKDIIGLLDRYKGLTREEWVLIFLEGAASMAFYGAEGDDLNNRFYDLLKFSDRVYRGKLEQLKEYKDDE